MKKTKKKRNAQKKRSSHQVRGVSSGAGRQSTVEKICERGILSQEWKSGGTEVVADVKNGESTEWEDVVEAGKGKLETERLEDEVDEEN